MSLCFNHRHSEEKCSIFRVHEVRDSNSLNPLFVRKSPGKFNSLTMWRTYPANLIMLAAAHSNKSREQCASVQSKNPVLYSFYCSRCNFCPFHRKRGSRGYRDLAFGRTKEQGNKAKLWDL